MKDALSRFGRLLLPRRNREEQERSPPPRTPRDRVFRPTPPTPQRQQQERSTPPRPTRPQQRGFDFIPTPERQQQPSPARQQPRTDRTTEQPTAFTFSPPHPDVQEEEELQEEEGLGNHTTILSV
jgi:hypothetical protein